MTFWRLILRSFWFDRRQNFVAALAMSVAAAAIVGAGLIGSSVRGSLDAIAGQRLGDVGSAVATQDRMMTAALAERLSNDLGVATAAVLSVQGVVARPDGSARANAVQVLGIDDAFWALSPSRQAFGIPDGQAILNAPLARQLGVGDDAASAGEDVILRLTEPSVLPSGTPLAGGGADAGVTARVTVAAPPVADADFGRFSLRAEQQAPMTIFVPRSWLAERLDLAGRANLLLIARSASAMDAEAAIARQWQLADGELEWRETPTGHELATRRVFLDHGIGEAVDGEGVLTYLANEVRHGERVTPYSMISGLSPTLLKQLGVDGLADDEIIINDWLADDLAVQPGDAVSVTYYVIDEDRQLVEQTTALKVRSVVPIQGLAADQTLTPDFPGLADADSYRDWDAGPGIDRTRIRNEDEDYWDQYRATPKAFVTLATAQTLWSNRFGDLTQVRFSTHASSHEEPSETRISNVDEQTIRTSLDPQTFGLTAQPVSDWANAAAGGTVDFGQLFTGLSLFIIVAALLLAGLLQVFAVEQRSGQLGVLLASGWSTRRVRWMLMLEGAVMAAAGCVLGAVLGVFYARLVLWALNAPWAGAVASVGLAYHGSASAVLLGGFAAWGMSVLTLALTTWKTTRRTVTGLLSADFGSAPISKAGSRWPLALTILCMCAAVALFAFGSGDDPPSEAGRFFGIGALLLTGLVSAVWAWLRVFQTRGPQHSAGFTSRAGLAFQQLRRRAGRSLTTLALVASSVFIVTAVSLFRLQVPDDPTVRASGTGGFTLLAESTLPIPHDLNAEQGREQLGLDAETMDGVRVLPVRVHGGDDASCLNLNLAPEPRLLGVDAAALAERESFTFTQGNGWGELQHHARGGVVPAVADQSTAQWALKMSIGDRLTYTNERGEPFEVELVGMLRGSILQGALLVADDQLHREFPGLPGQRMMLIDTPRDRAQAVREELSVVLQDYGVEITPTLERLAAFNRVQNTYLAMFQTLGALGVGLGSFGLGVVVLRNLLERRAEFATMRATGWNVSAIRRLLWREHLALMGLGLLAGWLASLIAVAPAVIQRGFTGWGSLALVLALSAAVGVLSIGLVLALKTRDIRSENLSLAARV